MSGYIKTLKDNNRDSIYPVTVPDAILDSQGNKVIDQLKNMINENAKYTYWLEDDPDDPKSIRLASGILSNN